MAVFKVTRRWANQIADGTHELYQDRNWQPKTGDPVSCLSDLFREGQTLSEVLVRLGISMDQYHKACSLSKKFHDQHKEGLLKAEAWWATLGRAGAAGKAKIQANTYRLVMINRFGWSGSSDKLDVRGGVDDVDKNRTITPEMTPEDAAKVYAAEILGQKT